MGQYGILGGGFLGLTLAHRLAQRGHNVTVLEGAPELGGLASAWQLGDVTWDRHYHVTLLSDLRLRALLGELGLERDLRWVQTKTGFFTDGKLHSMSSTLEFLTFPPLGPIDKLRLGATIFYASKITDWRKLERVPVADWLRRLSGDATFERIWLPLLRAKLGDNYTKASASFIWAIIARMYAARRTGLKKEMFGYVPGGYARVLQRFGEVLAREGVRVEVGRRATRVSRTKAGKLSVSLDGARARSFDNVVVTAASPVAAELCEDLLPGEKARLAGVEYQGIVCCSLLLKAPLATYYVTNITDAWVPFTAVIEMTTLVDRAEVGGHALVYLPKYVAQGDPTFTRSDDELREEYLSVLERMYPRFRRADVLAFKVSRVRHVFPIATLGYSDRAPSIRTSVPGLYTVSSANILNGTLNVNETVQLAERASEEVLAP